MNETGASAELVITNVLDQFARNFLLNDLSTVQSGKLLEATRGDVMFQLPRREARRRDTDIGRVHQARVSVRRLRSVVRAYSGLFEAEWSVPLLVELSWYAGVLGEVRDLDVLRSGIVKSLSLVEDEPLKTEIEVRLDKRINEAQERSALERATKRYALLVDGIATIGSSVALNTRAKGPALKVLGSQIKGPWRDVRKANRTARSDSSNENLHKLRIELKRLQCAGEVLGLVVGKPAVKMARAAETTQTKLGVVHDEAVASAWLNSLTVVDPDWKAPLREIRTFHKDARREAKRGWRDSFDNVARSWDDLES
ncbi:MAG TPA: CHAD domain-containing protein [Acidimicrobiales bacterium]|nr:CHAD domain-containing protein [Acidimicrobiales bacterium]